MEEVDTSKPLTADVSVIIPCCNLEAYLGEAVESVWSQTLHPKEVIIIHDGCKQPQMYKDTHSVFRENNLGVAESRDEGVRIAKGSNLLFLDADDALPETFIQEMLSTLERGADIAYPDVLLWSRWGEATFANCWHRAKRYLTLKDMLHHNHVVVSSLMKRKVYEAVGGFDPTLEIFEDWDFLLKAMVKGFVFRKANTHLKYRQRTQGRNRQNDALKKEVCQLVRARYQDAQK